MTKFKPLGNRVVVKRSKAATSKGGILLPESAQEAPKQGTVVAVGPGKTDDNGKAIPMDVALNDEVLFSSYAGTKAEEGEDEYLILSEDEIYGVIQQ